MPIFLSAVNLVVCVLNSFAIINDEMRSSPIL